MGARAACRTRHHSAGGRLLTATPTAVLTTAELTAVAEAMRGAGEPVAGPLAAELITGGRSNLTFRLDDGEHRWVLRMPPRAGRTPSAHDVAREFRVTAALASTDVPVARAVVLCEDETLLGGPFAVAAFVDGRTIQTRTEFDELHDAELVQITDQLVSTLAALHAVDHLGLGLERFGRPDGYAARQLTRWAGQWDLVGAASLRPLAAEVIARLNSGVPDQPAIGIVHGDFRIDNTLLDLRVEPRVAAIVDWELSTIGDPVADVAMMCAYRDRAFDLIVGSSSAWTSPRLPDVAGLAAAYEHAGGVDLIHWEFHLALAYLKIAVIAAGIEHRLRAGAASGVGFNTAGQSVQAYLELARTTVGAHR
jgi:aminoglycoside phosphotransferase (APT) family kinase protein